MIRMQNKFKKCGKNGNKFYAEYDRCPKCKKIIFDKNTETETKQSSLF